MEKEYTLVWVPVENAKRQDIPFSFLGDTGRLVYKLPSTLTFGHLELNGINITGYFKPADDDMEYICRPWMVGPVAPPTVTDVAPEIDDEPEVEEAPNG